MKAGPLRGVVDWVIPPQDAYSRQKVRLECGHTVWCDANVIYRTRCRHCANIPEPTLAPTGNQGSDR